MLTLNNQTPEQKLHRDVQRRIEAALSTGNFDAARTALTEYSAEYPTEGMALRQQVVRDYGTML